VLKNGVEPPAQVAGQSPSSTHVPQAGALERADHVVGVPDDQVACCGRARLAEHQLVVDLRPDRHHQVAQPHEAVDRLAGQHVRDAAGDERIPLRLGPAGQDGARRPGDLVVARAGLEVFLVDLRPGRQPVPEQIRQAGTVAASVRRRVGVEPAELGDAVLAGGHRNALVAVDASEHLAP
jgi:hypothetical protein